MINITKDKYGFTFEFYIIPKCFWFMNHNYGKWGKAYQVNGGHWYQSRLCNDCGKVVTRDAGFIQSLSLHIDEHYEKDIK